MRGGSRTLGNYPSPALALTYKVLLGLFTTGSASLSYLTEALVHIYIPQPRGDLAVRCLCRKGLTCSRGHPLRSAFPHLCVLIIAHFVKFVKRFLKKIRNFFSVAFATTHLYRVLLPSVGCFLIYSSFLPFATERMTEVLFAYQLPEPILSASS